MNPPSIFGQPILTILAITVVSAIGFTVRWWTTRGKNIPDSTPESSPRAGIIALCLWVLSISIFMTSSIFVLTLDQTQLRSLALTEEKLVQIQSNLSLTQTAFDSERSNFYLTQTAFAHEQAEIRPTPTLAATQAGASEGATEIQTATPIQPPILATVAQTSTTTSLNAECAGNDEVLYDFEQETHQWNTSEGEFKLAELALTDEVRHCGRKSLQVLTDLDATSSDVYHHTDSTAYFDRAIPLAFEGPGPYDFSEKTVGCFVFIPPDFPNDEGDIVNLLLSVKDRTFRNQQGEFIEISEDHLGTWMHLTLFVEGEGEGADAGFEPSHVNALSVWIGTPSHSRLKATVKIYIDDCTLS